MGIIKKIVNYNQINLVLNLFGLEKSFNKQEMLLK